MSAAGEVVIDGLHATDFGEDEMAKVMGEDWLVFCESSFGPEDSDGSPH